MSAIRVLFVAVTAGAMVTRASSQVNMAENFTCKNGDSFTGPVVAASATTLTIKVLRLKLVAKNIASHSVADAGMTLIHKDGTVFSGRFLITPNGDFVLNEQLYPENFDLLRQDIAKREPTAIPPAQTPEIQQNMQVYAAVGVAATVSAIRQLLPGLASAHIGASRSFAFFGHAWYSPHVFAETGFHYAHANPYLLLGGSLVLGPEWHVNIAERQRIFFQLGAGMNYLRVRDLLIDQAHISGYGHARLGYSYLFDRWFIFAAATVAYMHDPAAPLTAAGGHFGVGKVMGDKN